MIVTMDPAGAKVPLGGTALAPLPRRVPSFQSSIAGEMAESSVKSPSTSSTTRSEGDHHPSLALVLLATGGPEVLRSALHAVAPACIEAAAELCVVWAGDTSPALGEWPGLVAQCLRVDAASSTQDRRQQAARALGADILLFTDDRAALPLPWQDILAFRLGLLRSGTAAGGWGPLLNAGDLPRGGAPV